ncbi:hypothetical protein Tco_0864435 [Tanacetum coccineum]
MNIIRRVALKRLKHVRLVEICTLQPIVVQKRNSKTRFLFQCPNRLNNTLRLKEFVSIVETCCMVLIVLNVTLTNDIGESFQKFQNTSKSSNDNSNVVNAPREPFVVKQDPSVNSSQKSPLEYEPKVMLRVGNDVEYVEASPPNSEPVSSKVMEIVIPEVGRIEDDILLIKDDTLREKLLNVNRLVAKIEALKDNPVPSSLL